MRNALSAVALLLAMIVSGRPAGAEEKAAEDGRAGLAAAVAKAVAAVEKQDPSAKAFLETAHAYVVFPTVGEGAVAFGGGRGRGVVFREGKPIGYAQVTFATVGLDGGGAAFTEVIAFEDAAALERFADNRFAFGPGAAAVVLKDGAAKDATFAKGAVALVSSAGGEAPRVDLATQKFSFVPAEK